MQEFLTNHYVQKTCTMETLYDWLLYNTGNAANYYTILNTQRDQAGNLDVMIRSSDFKVLNLFIYDSQGTVSQDRLHEFPGEALKDQYLFSDEQQVIAYLSEGKMPESKQNDTGTGIQVFVAEPTSESGDVTFPPAQA